VLSHYRARQHHRSLFLDLILVIGTATRAAHEANPISELQNAKRIFVTLDWLSIFWADHFRHAMLLYFSVCFVEHSSAASTIATHSHSMMSLSSVSRL
jgi:hypothetical protein